MNNLSKDLSNSIKTSNSVATKKEFLAIWLWAFTAFSVGTSYAATPTTIRSKGDNISGFYLGAELGSSAIFNKESTTTTETNTTTTETRQSNEFPSVGNVGIKLGYTHFFNKWAGIRGYASYHYGFVAGNTSTSGGTEANSNSSTLMSYHQVAGNVEATFKFFDISGVGLGAYAGLGVGYGYADSSTTSTADNTTTTTNTKLADGFVLPVNIGLEVYMGKHHNASLNFRIPTLATTLTTSGTEATSTTKTELRNLIITLGYSYTF